MNNQLAALLAMLAGSGFLGSALPPLVAVVVQSHWPNWAKALTAFGFSAIIGTASAWAAGEFNALGVPAAIIVALTASEQAYQKWWKPKGIAPVIETATNNRAPSPDVAGPEADG